VVEAELAELPVDHNAAMAAVAVPVADAARRSATFWTS